MGHNIKQLKPSKQSRYSQGYVDPRSCKKIIDRSSPVIYRSSYERKFIVWLECSKQITKWGSECIAIPYFMPDGSKHNYYPDYYMETVDGKKCLVEIKPSNQTRPPVNENSWAQKEWIRNSCKWKAALQFCKSRGIDFKIITENTISKLNV